MLTLPAAAVLLWLNRRSVRRGMTTGASHPESPPPSASAATPYPPMRIIDCAADPPAYAERSLRAAVTIYAAAGLAFALLFVIGWGMQSEGAAWTWLHLLAFAMTLAVVYFWPAVLANRISRSHQPPSAPGYRPRIFHRPHVDRRRLTRRQLEADRRTIGYALADR